MARPSPRTQGVDEEGKTFQKFGTQQLSFAAGTPPKLGTPYQGVTQVDTGKNWKAITTAPFQAVKWLTGLQTGTAFSQQFQSGRTGSLPLGATYIPPPTTATPNGGETTMDEKCHLDDNKPFCGFTELIGGEKCECPNWFTGEVTPTDPKRGCECEACKNGTGQCSDKVPICDAWDLTCEGTGGAFGGGTDVWLWVKIILILIGVGVFLWLLRPLFGIAKNITEN